MLKIQKNNDHKHNESQTRYKLIFKKNANCFTYRRVEHVAVIPRIISRYIFQWCLGTDT